MVRLEGVNSKVKSAGNWNQLIDLELHYASTPSLFTPTEIRQASLWIVKSLVFKAKNGRK
jgi:hypothetical protein